MKKVKPFLALGLTFALIASVGFASTPPADAAKSSTIELKKDVFIEPVVSPVLFVISDHAPAILPVIADAPPVSYSNMKAVARERNTAITDFSPGRSPDGYNLLNFTYRLSTQSGSDQSITAPPNAEIVNTTLIAPSNTYRSMRKICTYVLHENIDRRNWKYHLYWRYHKKC